MYCAHSPILGAVAIFWNVAQQTSLRALVINLGPHGDAASAASAIDVSMSQNYAHANATHVQGVGGGGTVEDITINGGQYGIRVQASQYTFRGIRCAGQTVAAFALGAMVQMLVFVDVAVSNSGAVLVARDTPSLPGGQLDSAAR